MESYWFYRWMKRNGVHDATSLSKALRQRKSFDSLISDSPPTVVSVRHSPGSAIELTAGKGIDLTGALGCSHVDCLKREVDELLHHIWHYFDRVLLPDQALLRIVSFRDHGDREALTAQLGPFVTVLMHLKDTGVGDLVSFEVRAPSCRQHHQQHAHEAGIDQALPNLSVISGELAASATIEWKQTDESGHPHIDYRLDHHTFEHSAWGELCSNTQALPSKPDDVRVAVAEDVIRRYLAELSADALAARRTKTALGTSIRYYRRLLATRPTPQIEDVAFELALPVAPGVPIKTLLALREAEKPSFERFQLALRTAIAERIRSVDAPDPAKIADQIKGDVIAPRLRDIRDKLATTTSMAKRSAAVGTIIGAAAATVGLLTPLSGNPVGAGLAVGGAITLGAASVKKAVDDYLVAQRDVKLSDMYFLWKAHTHAVPDPQQPALS